jgi:hypothetical protein
MVKILTETFAANGSNVYGEIVGAVKIDLGYGRIVIAKARETGPGEFAVMGFIGRYRTSSKPWIVHVIGKGEKLFVHFGRDDRSGMFQKERMISWEPDLYEKISNFKAWRPV